MFLLLDVTEDQIKEQLAEEELEMLTQGGAVTHETGPSAFLDMGLVLEETQWVRFYSTDALITDNHA